MYTLWINLASLVLFQGTPKGTKKPHDTYLRGETRQGETSVTWRLLTIGNTELEPALRHAEVFYFSPSF